MKKINQKGFSIIEVLIVLAIAGLIMLIVFLAVPALQRNSRNTQRRQDVSSTISAIQEYMNNNNGKLPTDNNTLTAAINNAKLGFYDVSNLNGANSTTWRTTASATVATNASDVFIINYAKCGSIPAAGTAAIDLSTGGPTKRNVVAVYQSETSSNFQVQCIDM